MTNSKHKIPKIIHYCWFGDGKKPRLVQKCIKSWKKYCPDWEIREWNNEDLKNCTNSYALEAAHANKWAFVSDYFRLKALHEFGGVYLDTDVELTNSLDEFLNNDFFTGHHKMDNGASIATNLIAATKNCTIINSLLEEYDNMDFITKDGRYNMIPNPAVFLKLFEKKYGYVFNNGENTIKLEESSVIYPWWFFSIPKKNCKNYAIHHFMRSWHKENLSIKNWIFSKHKYSTTHYLIVLFGFKLKFKYKNKG